MKKSRKKTNFSKEGSQQLIKKYNGVLRNNLKVISDSFDYYELNDGRLLIVEPFDGTGTLYESEKIFRDLMQKFDELVEKKGKNFHVLKGVFQGGVNFPQDIEKYVNDLSLLTRINRGQLDFSLESLKTLDLTIKDWSIQDIIEKLYAPLIAYTGEVIRRKVSGQWEIKNVGEEINEPYIISGDKRYETFIDLYKEFNENYDNISTYTVVLAELNKYLLSPR